MLEFPLEISRVIINSLNKKAIYNAMFVNKEWYMILFPLLYSNLSFTKKKSMMLFLMAIENKAFVEKIQKHVKHIYINEITLPVLDHSIMYNIRQPAASIFLKVMYSFTNLETLTLHKGCAFLSLLSESRKLISKKLKYLVTDDVVKEYIPMAIALQYKYRKTLKTLNTYLDSTLLYDQGLEEYVRAFSQLEILVVNIRRPRIDIIFTLNNLLDRLPYLNNLIVNTFVGMKEETVMPKIRPHPLSYLKMNVRNIKLNEVDILQEKLHELKRFELTLDDIVINRTIALQQLLDWEHLDEFTLDMKCHSVKLIKALIGLFRPGHSMKPYSDLTLRISYAVRIKHRVMKILIKKDQNTDTYTVAINITLSCLDKDVLIPYLLDEIGDMIVSLCLCMSSNGSNLATISNLCPNLRLLNVSKGLLSANSTTASTGNSLRNLKIVNEVEDIEIISMSHLIYPHINRLTLGIQTMINATIHRSNIIYLPHRHLGSIEINTKRGGPVPRTVVVVKEVDGRVYSEWRIFKEKRKYAIKCNEYTDPVPADSIVPADVILKSSTVKYVTVLNRF